MNEKLPINYHLFELQEIEGLSKRARTVCLDNALNSLYKLINYYQQNGSFFALRSCGSKTNSELVALINKYAPTAVLNQVEPGWMLQHDDFEVFRIDCYEHFKLSTHKVEPFRNEFLENKLPVFNFILTVLNHRLNERDYYIFRQNLRYFLDTKSMTLQALGDHFIITRESIRRHAYILPYKLREILTPLGNQLNHINERHPYELRRLKDFIVIDDELRDHINKAEGLTGTTRFFAFGFSILLSREYYYFQDIYNNYKHHYLINRKLAEQFDFAEFFYDLKTKLTSKFSKTYTLDFRHYLRSFYRPGKFSFFERIVELCKLLMAKEFGLKCSHNDELVILRTTKTRLIEYIFQILEEKNRPMHLKEIAMNLSSRFPTQKRSLESIRTAIIISGSIIAIGKTSTYALSAWSHVKQGTIRELAKEYLENHELPVHLHHLANYIMQYRNTTVRSISANLSLDQNKTFIIFPGKYVGLASKNYPPSAATNKQLSLL